MVCYDLRSQKPWTNHRKQLQLTGTLSRLPQFGKQMRVGPNDYLDFF